MIWYESESEDDDYYDAPFDEYDGEYFDQEDDE